LVVFLGFNFGDSFATISLNNAFILEGTGWKLMLSALSYKHILVPYDGTKTGDRAFNGAIQLAKKFGSKITLLACVERESTLRKPIHQEVTKDDIPSSCLAVLIV
jgi:hypothetical protein